jgi:hypothetical protein
MKPTPLRPLRPKRYLFARGLGLRLWLRDIANRAAYVAVGMTCVIAIGYMLSVGVTGN